MCVKPVKGISKRRANILFIRVELTKDNKGGAYDANCHSFVVMITLNVLQYEEKC